jgi:hypothetical protein
MDTHNTDRIPTKARPIRPDCCADEKCTSGSRNNYFTGKRLTADVFRVEQTYMVERRHLLNRAIHGWGVVYGYSVAMAAADQACPGAERGQLEIGEGLALDQAGRELLQTGRISLTLDAVTLLDDEGKPIRADRCGGDDGLSKLKPEPDWCWRLNVHYAEQAIGPVTLKDPCTCDRKEWDRVCETVRYTLQRIDCDKCCDPQECELKCCCATGPCCESHDTPRDGPRSDADLLRAEMERELRELRARGVAEGVIEQRRQEYEEKLKYIEAGDQTPKPEPERLPDRGGCRCLCDHLTGLRPGVECATLCAVDDCARVDLRNGVPLACVKLEQDDCKGWRFGTVVDACGPRRLVKRNDLLFDLIRGCDVTRISEIGWKAWHRLETPVPFDDFSKALGPSGQDADEYVTTDFWVRFSRPVRASTVRPDCFAMTVLSNETEGGWWQPLRVPIIRVDTTVVAPHADDPANHVRGARIVVDGGWLEDAVRGRKSIFFAGPTRVEFEIRGDFIVDCNGQTLDANARGLLPFPSGSDGPGDAFLSTFTVGERPPPSNRAKSTERPPEGVTS